MSPSGTPASQQQSKVEPGRGQGWVRRLWRYVLRHRRDVVIAMAAAVLGSVCQTVVPLVERQIIDNVILVHKSPLWPWLLLLIVLAAGAFGFAYVRRYRGGRVALGVQLDLRNDMHDHLQSMDFDNLNRMPTGQLVARANSDTTLVQGLLSFFPIMSGNLLLMVVSLAVMFYLSPLLAVVSLVVAPTLLLVSYRMRWRIFPATWDGQQREGDVAQVVDEDVNGVRVVKAFGQEHARGGAGGRCVQGCLRLPDAGRSAPIALPASARGDPHHRPGEHPVLRGLVGPPGRHHPGDVPCLFDLYWPADGARAPAGRGSYDRATGPCRGRPDLPAARPEAGHCRPSGCHRAVAS